MESTQSRDQGVDIESAPHFVDHATADEPHAWEEIESGRFMPRRIRGSYKGRALG